MALYQTMAEQRVTNAELGRRLKLHMPQVDRILNVRYASQIGQVISAFTALGKRVEFNVVDAPRPLPGSIASVAKRPARVASRATSGRVLRAAKKALTAARAASPGEFTGTRRTAFARSRPRRAARRPR